MLMAPQIQGKALQFKFDENVNSCGRQIVGASMHHMMNK